jgi:hypothetical protein
LNLPSPAPSSTLTHCRKKKREEKKTSSGLGRKTQRGEISIRCQTVSYLSSLVVAGGLRSMSPVRLATLEYQLDEASRAHRRRSEAGYLAVEAATLGRCARAAPRRRTPLHLPAPPVDVEAALECRRRQSSSPPELDVVGIRRRPRRGSTDDHPTYAALGGASTLLASAAPPADADGAGYNADDAAGGCHSG